MSRSPTQAAASFLPDGFDPGDFSHIEPLGERLLERRVSSEDELRRWVHDAAELFEAIDEEDTRRHIDAACHTDDERVERRYLDFVRNVQPRLEPLMHRLQQRYLQLAERYQPDELAFAMLTRDWETDASLFREANVPLHTRETELANEHGKITGAMSVRFRGGQYTLQQLSRFLQEPDRETRREAWQAAADRRLAERDRLDELFDQLLDLRQQIAANAGFDSYRGYVWREKKRFDYTPDDCHTFADAVRTVCVPLVRELDEQRRRALGVEELRPWDGAVDPKGRPPLRPFDADDPDALVSGVRRIFERIDPELARLFATLPENGDLDLKSRTGKRPGGFQAALERARRPFIFMNAAGLQGDVDTLLHEAGHAFHYLDSRDEPNLFVRHAPMEFCEVASMAMELIAADHHDVFHDGEEDAARARRHQLEQVIRKLPWIATIDQFQHWIYGDPAHTAEQRTEAWGKLLDQFSGGIVDWTGCEEAREAMWQKQLHLFQAPFYYIEYGIAQLGALQVWAGYRRDPQAALRKLRKAFALGGTRPLGELFETAGVRFAFDEVTLRPLIDDVRAELDKLPM